VKCDLRILSASSVVWKTCCGKFIDMHSFLIYIPHKISNVQLQLDSGAERKLSTSRDLQSALSYNKVSYLCKICWHVTFQQPTLFGPSVLSNLKYSQVRSLVLLVCKDKLYYIALNLNLIYYTDWTAIIGIMLT
jgi:hypothetical protein